MGLMVAISFVLLSTVQRIYKSQEDLEQAHSSCRDSYSDNVDTTITLFVRNLSSKTA